MRRVAIASPFVLAAALVAAAAEAPEIVSPGRVVMAPEPVIAGDAAADLEAIGAALLLSLEWSLR